MIAEYRRATLRQEGRIYAHGYEWALLTGERLSQERGPRGRPGNVQLAAHDEITVNMTTVAVLTCERACVELEAYCRRYLKVA